jgi:hypothetical protein
MTRKKPSRGICSFCQHESTKGGITQHLPNCPQRLAQIAEATQSSRKAETLIHLRAQDYYDSQFWFDIEMNGSAKLHDLDTYLRSIWLECCGHLSTFARERWGRDELPFTQTLRQIWRAIPAGQLAATRDVWLYRPG